VKVDQALDPVKVDQVLDLVKADQVSDPVKVDQALDPVKVDQALDLVKVLEIPEADLKEEVIFLAQEEVLKVQTEDLHQDLVHLSDLVVSSYLN
jgi:hypothetical protein